MPPLLHSFLSLPADVLEAIKHLNSGLREAKAEYEAELADAAAAAASPQKLPPAARQAAFNSSIEAAAAELDSGSKGGGEAGGEGEGEAAREPGSPGAPATPPPSPFAAMLQGFLADAKAGQASLSAAQEQTEAVVHATVAWLGEAAEPDPSPTFELLLKFVMDFDHAYRKVFRAVVGK